MTKLFEAFSGYGSQALALERYGVEFESVGIAEIDKYAIAAHKSLHGDVENYGDVSKLSVDELPNMDLFTYSFPCQDISNAGLQRGLEKGSGTRSSLLWECERIIEGKRPKYLMMENVKNLVGKKNKPFFDKWLKVLEDLGYNNYWKVINAKWCGVPQNRERVFCVSILKEFDNGKFHFEEEFDNGIRLKDILEDVVDEKYYLSEKALSRLTNNNQGFHSEPKNGEDIASPLMASDYKVPRGMNIIIDGNVSPNNHGGGNVYNSNGISRTILARDYKDPVKISVREATKKGYKEAYEGDSINLEQPNSKTRRGRVGNQVANTLTTSCNQAVVEGAAIRGRYNEQGKTVQKLELNNSEFSNTITTVQKDSLVAEPKIMKIGKESGNHYGGGLYSTDGISPTLVSSGAGGGTNNIPKVPNDIRIRKLTPRECFRLMGLQDCEIDKLQATIVNKKPISNSQQYKLAGNSIVVDCMKFLKNLED